MHKTINWQIKIFAILIMFSFLFPAIKIGGFGMKPDLILLLPLLLSVLIVDNKIRKARFFREVFIIVFFLFLNMFLSDTFGLINFKSQTGLYFPTEFIQIFSKISVLYIFYFIAYREIISYSLFIKILNTIFIVSLIFGVLQIINFPAISKLSLIYALSENQVNGISSLTARIFSVTGNILTWAGISGFILLYGIILLKDSITKVLIIILSFVNLLFTSSRGALIAFVFVLIIYFIVNLSQSANAVKKLKKITIIFFFITLFSFLIITLFKERVILIFERFTVLNDAITKTGRNQQLESIFKIFNSDPWNYLFGVGKPYIDSIGLMEIEILFIFFCYGIAGVVLHYSLLFLILKYIIKNTDYVLGKNFIVLVIIYYFIFSFGFFFLRESFSAIIFWAIIGYIIGYSKIFKYESSSIVIPHH